MKRGVLCTLTLEFSWEQTLKSVNMYNMHFYVSLPQIPSSRERGATVFFDAYLLKFYERWGRAVLNRVAGDELDWVGLG